MKIHPLFKKVVFPYDEQDHYLGLTEANARAYRDAGFPVVEDPMDTISAHYGSYEVVENKRLRDALAAANARIARLAACIRGYVDDPLPCPHVGALKK